MTKKIVVFGGSGFLGSHVADELSEAGYEVTIFDKNRSKWIKPNQTMSIGDIRDKEEVIKAITGAKKVFNFAALADLNIGLDKPLDTAEINILGNLNVLEACRLNNIEHLIYASSVYAQSKDGGFYGCSKRAAEDYIKLYKQKYELNYTILRYGSIYGPRADASNFIWKTVKAYFDTGQLNYLGRLNAVREYIHVQDAARATVDVSVDKYKNQTMVLSGNQSIKIFDLFTLICEVFDIPNDNVSLVEGDYAGHYTLTPYTEIENLPRKYVLPTHIELAQGILDLKRHINDE